ncbi:valyl-tRNA synthetase [Desulfonatronum thiosulfatophilum]|uniref:Valine--tRNA ligase n=1 Tax=Desulfonatronum thiosulfatophilum TaxID=617002 RepID=A0A1G6AGY3_9BACT|nr:valine--tRNA ligase [Desulfonatronum thiosulfatophilum]SDB07580.1 valyl-tRNA synthetase [Desulfonatronum thiosulfatophilum]
MNDTKLPKGYEPRDVEAKWLEYWEEQGVFTAPAQAERPAYSMVIPPPNVTGSLHMGHALNLTLQDILCRFHRQQGHDVLWVPGTDHAGIATQNVVEKSLAAQGKSREELGREAFVERVWAWKEEYGGKILNQVRRLGASVDWSRLRFTMDDGLSRAVREVFVRLYDEGLIYKGDYIINWCPRCRTALADLEVEHAQAEGKLHAIRYPLADGSGDLTVMTTRPETMLGDTAVAVHPEDERFSHLVGKEVILPLVGRKLPIIADSYVDREFGTGCLKVTPAHDMNDFELGRRHSLDVIKVIDDQGRMSADAGSEYAGLDRMECRQRIVQDLQDKGFLVRVEDHPHSVGHCYRCRAVIEPSVSKQWFVAVQPLAAKARKAVEDGRTEILPRQWERTYFDWLDNIRDWCISRQIWWGHRIPAWTCQACGEMIVAREDPQSCTKCSGKLVQESDVLDTWFSSALWPFSTLGWPDETPELRSYYPTSVLVTGFDILFFWVARMMMMGLHFREDVPFRHVYIHALVRDSEGQKMSKSKGNVIDPLTMVDQYGTDALRLTLTAMAAMGRDIKLSEERIQGYRFFVNKLWNAARFALINLPPAESATPLPTLPAPADLDVRHRWILTRLEQNKRDVAAAITEYRFNDAAMGLYQFVWHELCDWYLEMIKPDLSAEEDKNRESAQACLHTVLSEVLTLLHPIMPFVTQEIWSCLPGMKEPNLAAAAYPVLRPEHEDEQVLRDMALIQEIVVSVRNIRSELSIGPSLKLTVLVRGAEEAVLRTLETNQDTIIHLARLDNFQVGTELTPPKASASAVVQGLEVFVPLAGAVDFQTELARLEKELAKTAKDLDIVSRKVANEDFMAKAPAEVVEKERAKARDLSEKQSKLLGLRTRLQSLME